MRPGRTIIVGADGSDDAVRAVRWAAVLASRTQAQLRIVHAIPLFEMYVGIPDVVAGPSMRGEFLASGEKILSIAKAVAQEVDAAIDIELVCIDTDFGDFMIASSRTADMVVLGSHGYGRIGEIVLGSSLTRIVQRAHCPVAISKSDRTSAESSSGPVLVGVDTGPDHNEVLTAAFGLASALRRPLTAVQAWTRSPVSAFEYATAGDGDAGDSHRRRTLLEDRVSAIAALFPDVEVVTSPVTGSPAHELRILAAAVRASIIVVGSRGRGPLAGAVLGSTSQNLIHHASCSVLVVR